MRLLHHPDRREGRSTIKEDEEKEDKEMLRKVAPKSETQKATLPSLIYDIIRFYQRRRMPVLITQCQSCERSNKHTK